ncbi:hypothetical protein Y032_0009g593 [Ancylostoma ceylanicum]|uniref:Uncharacterized protein n=1 Tax=Ancylostoma ceylanicum TaxID=53326 RepID=A0A016VHZ0_9BILA|nr:hypothetical protein Y032_0009g593 [Ancylostoma ceylanicum]
MEGNGVLIQIEYVPLQHFPMNIFTRLYAPAGARDKVIKRFRHLLPSVDLSGCTIHVTEFAERPDFSALTNGNIVGQQEETGQNRETWAEAEQLLDVSKQHTDGLSEREHSDQAKKVSKRNLRRRLLKLVYTDGKLFTVRAA